eukprot:TRINITY_DN9450_c0_g2_i1.p1 TRINITY_DN9450_c0_g2~~TRINITY_DN9450_c0_g2_i1.p1  ORF type:complete len:263 (-),score=45.47 TRINITY_DN9450_c0_g2_i1:54-842(-)
MTKTQEQCQRRRLRTKMAPPPSFRNVEALNAGHPAGFRIKERHAEYVVVESAFDRSQLDLLAQFLKRKRPRAAKMKNEGAGDSDDERKARYDDRDSKVCWFNAEKECPWLQLRLKDLIKEVGNAEWPLIKVNSLGELSCTYEDTQYAVYGEKQHFQAWHQDAFAEGNDPEDARQMTVVVMLSKQSDYTGGHFQAKLRPPSGGRKVIKKIQVDAGDAIVFPAKRLLHRVSMVKSGLRKTLVFWAWDETSSRFHTGGNPQSPAA